MLLQSIFTQRIIIILLVQVWPILLSSYLAYKILKRAKNRSTFILSSFFILISSAYFFATLSAFLLNTSLAYLFYIVGIYFFFFSHCFLTIFSWVLVKLADKSSFWKSCVIIILYGVISTYIFWIGFYFNGIMYDSSTNWIPTYSWFFLIFSWAILLIFLITPQIYFSFKLLKIFEGVILKQRINRFIISVFLEFIMVFSVFLYNTWVESQIYRTFYILVLPITSNIAAFLIYKSFGKELE
ncbi:MAG: hypothetical protein KGD68_03070 [Candidatus Lokiarchaeota archaeon]|nr:hypothetical protein [Candidatus Lokiarchaeota archaeon]